MHSRFGCGGGAGTGYDETLVDEVEGGRPGASYVLDLDGGVAVWREEGCGGKLVELRSVPMRVVGGGEVKEKYALGIVISRYEVHFYIKI